MDRRTMTFLMMMLAAVGGPYFLMGQGDSTLWPEIQRFISALGPDGPETLSMESPPSLDPEQPSLDAWESGPHGPDLTFDEAVNLKDALNFNITPGWVTSNWPYVSTALAELDMQGMRVALVTGTDGDDLHGSMTYYFDSRHRLLRLTFHGQTEDPGKLIELITKHHRFRQQRTLDAGLYLKRWNGKPTGFLLLDHATRSSHGDSASFQVTLEINRTDGPYRLSQESAELLAERREAGRW